MVVLDFTFLEAVFDDNHNSPFKVSYHVHKNVILKIKGSAASAVFIEFCCKSCCCFFVFKKVAEAAVASSRLIIRSNSERVAEDVCIFC